MKLTLIRHGKVNMTYEKRYDSASYDVAQEGYDTADIFPVPVEAADPAVKAALLPGAEDPTKRLKFYISTLPRTRQTLKGLYGGVPYTETDLLREVPLIASFDTARVLPRSFWRALGRTQWFLNRGRQPEHRRDTRQRAKKLVDTLIEKNEDAVLVTHEFYLYTLLSELKRRGFQVARPQKTRFRINNLEHIYAER